MSDRSAPVDPSQPAGKPGLFRRIWRAISGTGPSGRSALRAAAFRLQYDRFREILALNDTTLELIADIEDMQGGAHAIDLGDLSRRLRRATMDVFVMVKNLNLIAGDKHARLYDALRRINAAIEAELPPSHEASRAALVEPIGSLRRGDTAIAGSKMVRLAEAARAGEAIPPGFVATTSAFTRFMNDAGLWPEVDRVGAAAEGGDEAVLGRLCEELGRAIRGAEVPPDLADALLAAFDALAVDVAAESEPREGDATEGSTAPREAVGAPGAPCVAVRSSAVGEDEAASHAGQYLTVLSVSRERLLASYREVLASAFSPAAVSYRRGQGEAVARTMMAVGCLAMIEPVWSGVLFTRHFARPDDDQVVLSATRGLAQALVAGEAPGAEIVIDGSGRCLAGEPGALEGELLRLAGLARRLEQRFAEPLDVEWAIDRRGTLVVVQVRPMRFALRTLADVPPIGEGVEPLIVGGITACPGAASGPVVHVEDERDLETVEAGAIVVARHSAPWYSRVMPRIAALVTEIGSPVGHMAIIARELDLPCVVGMRGALRALVPGTVVTVDAHRGRVFPGALPLPERRSRRGDAAPPSPERERLKAIGARVTPLHLTSPSASEFTPEGCQTLHDITRYVHEKVFGVMFHFGDLAESDRDNAVRLDAALPIKVLVYDVGGGLDATVAPLAAATPSQVTSIPLRAFLDGLLDPRIVWNQPRPISGSGFLSVLGESMAGPPPDVQQIGRTSYAVVSDRYLNFSTKAGYHFSTVDTYCGASLNKNYVHFRFAGGATRAERRARRVRFLQLVLDELEFHTRPRGDILVARLEKYEREAIELRLRALGRLTMVTRQLDMMMDSDGSPEFFAKAFLEDRLDVF